MVSAPRTPTITPDSAGYLAFASINPLGYPLFIRALGAKAAIVAQPLIFAIALAYLGIETLRVTSSLVPAVAVIVASVFTPDLTAYHASILTESLFMSGLLMFLALCARFVRTPSARSAFLAATVAGLTGVVRRTGYALLPVLMVMPLLQWCRLPKPRGAIVIAAIVPMLGVLAVERIAAHFVHGDQLPSLLGRHLFAKAALIDAPAPPHAASDPRERRLEAHLDLTFAPIRALLHRAPQDVRTVLTLYYEACLQSRCVPELAAIRPGDEDRTLNDTLIRVSLARFGRAPMNVADLAAMNYRSFWKAYKLRDPAGVPPLNAFIASHRPLPLEREAFAVAPQDALAFQPSALVRFLQPFVLVIGWITGGLAVFGLGMAAARRAPSPAVSIACLASLAAHAALLFSALLARGISRYMIGVWPAIMIATIYAAWWTGRKLLQVTPVSRPATAREAMAGGSTLFDNG